MEICRRLEGMPLAIELAAARSRSLGLDGLLAGLDDHLRLLNESSLPDDRHGSIRMTIDWSYQLLDEDERAAFRRLSVFSGSFDLAAAATMAGHGDVAAASDVVGRLTDKSLLVHERWRTGSRWRMLDTVHAFAREQRDHSGETHTLLHRHHAWATATAHELETALDDPDWRDRFDAVAGDLRAALRRPPADAPADGPFALALVLGHLAYARRFLVEAREHFDTAVALAPNKAAEVVALRIAAGAAYAEMRGGTAFDLLQIAFARAMEVGDRRTAAIVSADAATLAGRCPALFVTPLEIDEITALVERARALCPPDDLEVAAHVAVAAAWTSFPHDGPTQSGADEALDLARRLDDPVLISAALDAATVAAARDERYRDASKVAGARLPFLARMPRHDPAVGGEVADMFHMASQAPISAGLLEEAILAAQISRDDDTYQGLSHFTASHLMVPLVLRGAFDESLTQADFMRHGWERAGRPPAGWMSPSFYAAAFVHGVRGDEEAFACWWDLAKTMQVISGPANCSIFFGCREALHRGAIDEACRLAAEVDPWCGGFFDPYAEAARVETAVVAAAPDAEEQLVQAQRLAPENDFVAPLLLRAAGRLHHDDTALKASIIGWEAIGARFERACTLLLLPDRAAEGMQEFAALGCPPPGTP